MKNVARLQVKVVIIGNQKTINCKNSKESIVEGLDNLIKGKFTADNRVL